MQQQFAILLKMLRRKKLKTLEEIENKISELKDEISGLIARRDGYLNERNEFAFNVMNEKIGKVLSKIEALEWVIRND